MLQLQLINNLIQKLKPEFKSTRNSLVSLTNENSLLAEQYKAIASKLVGYDPEPLVKSMVIASSQPGEGKTTTASNLAITIARSFEKRVLLVDADLRRPSIHKVFKLTNEIGLTDALNGEVDIRRSVQSLDIENLFIITSGTSTKHPSMLLNSSTMSEFHDRALKNFDIVIYDTPPILHVADTQAIGTLSDAVIFLVQADRTPKQMIEEALSILRDTEAHPDACILTGVKKSLDYYSYFTSANYRRNYYNDYPYLSPQLESLEEKTQFTRDTESL